MPHAEIQSAQGKTKKSYAHPDRKWEVHDAMHTMLRAHEVGSSRVDLQACKLEYSIVSPK